jgi:prepilin-type processing-associated H-X9-DG protein
MQRGKFYGVLYPGAKGVHGVDYSYGISVPLSAAGWTWQVTYAEPGDLGPRHLDDVDNFTSSRVLVADAGWTQVYNLSGDVLRTGIWNYPTQFDNTVAWWRHPGFGANLLLQDGHVKRVTYQLGAPHPVNTNSYFVWYPGEPLNVGPDDHYNGNYYPNDPPVDPANPADMGSYSLLSPGYYSKYRLWTYIAHK